MLDEKKLREYDEYLVDRENRRLKGKLTKEELEEEAALEKEKEIVKKYFSRLRNCLQE